jgi:hypothetical protein
LLADDCPGDAESWLGVSGSEDAVVVVVVVPKPRAAKADEMEVVRAEVAVVRAVVEVGVVLSLWSAATAALVGVLSVDAGGCVGVGSSR